jgi:hypothetical protein
MIDEDTPHRLGRDREEMGAILIGQRLAPDQTKTELVHDGVRLERMIAAFALKQAGGKLPQLGLNQGKQLVARFAVSVAPSGEPAGDIRCR